MSRIGSAHLVTTRSAPPSSGIAGLAAEAKQLNRQIKRGALSPGQKFAVIARFNDETRPELKRSGLPLDKARAFREPISIREGTTQFVVSSAVAHAIRAHAVTVDQVFQARRRLEISG
jgi:hypothetical protein